MLPRNFCTEDREMRPHSLTDLTIKGYRIVCISGNRCGAGRAEENEKFHGLRITARTGQFKPETALLRVAGIAPGYVRGKHPQRNRPTHEKRQWNDCLWLIGDFEVTDWNVRF